jgi:antitoxin MazE
MKSTIQKWGNSLAVRIPRPLTREVHIEQGSLVEVTVDKGSIVVTPDPEPAFRLEELLDQITESNLHGEIPTGGPVGREIG